MTCLDKAVSIVQEGKEVSGCEIGRFRHTGVGRCSVEIRTDADVDGGGMTSEGRQGQDEAGGSCGRGHDVDVLGEYDVDARGDGFRKVVKSPGPSQSLPEWGEGC